jgi:hypothetical protein
MIENRTNLNRFIQQVFPMRESQSAEISDRFREKRVAKNDFLLREGQVCNAYCFLDEGFMRTSPLIWALPILL